jgi:hypothetical protein
MTSSGPGGIITAINKDNNTILYNTHKEAATWPYKLLNKAME